MLAGDADNYDIESVRGIESWNINQRACILYEGKWRGGLNNVMAAWQYETVINYEWNK